MPLPLALGLSAFADGACVLAAGAASATPLSVGVDNMPTTANAVKSLEPNLLLLTMVILEHFLSILKRSIDERLSGQRESKDDVMQENTDGDAARERNPRIFLQYPGGYFAYLFFFANYFTFHFSLFCFYPFLHKVFDFCSQISGHCFTAVDAQVVKVYIFFRAEILV